MNALAQLGMVSEFPSDNQTVAAPDVDGVQKDYFVQRDGATFAGTHLLIDLWGASNLADPRHVDAALREAALAAGATILHSHFHHFSPNGGVSGVVVLAESISRSTHGRSGSSPRSTSSCAAPAIRMIRCGAEGGVRPDKRAAG